MPTNEECVADALQKILLILNKIESLNNTLLYGIEKDKFMACATVFHIMDSLDKDPRQWDVIKRFEIIEGTRL